MSKHEKLLKRLQERPKNFTWDEAVRVLGRCGFKQVERKGSSHKSFYCEEFDQIFHISQPHPGNELKRYQLDQLIALLKGVGCISYEKDT